MPEFDLMAHYPKTSREALLSSRVEVSAKDRIIAQQFGKEYFDGPRHLGLGGYYYNPKFFKPVVHDAIARYGLTSKSHILDIGCGKGFMLHDFKVILDANIAGIDISDYCLNNAMPDVRPFMQKASCDALPFPDNSFDCVISIATIHNLPTEGVLKSIREMIRVVKKPKNCFLKVNGYRTAEQRDLLKKWNLVAKTIFPATTWETIFETLGYVGDYSFFVP